MSGSQQRLSDINRNGGSCPICGRTSDRKATCRISENQELVLCRPGDTYHPPTKKKGEVVTGRDGKQWACAGPTKDGSWIQFRIPSDPPGPGNRRSPAPRRSAATPTANRPASSMEPAALQITGPITLAQLPQPWPDAPPDHLPDGHALPYSDMQKVVVQRKGAEKKHVPHHLVADASAGTDNAPIHQWVAKSGPDPWPWYHQQVAFTHGRGLWIVEAEGEKCADHTRAGGYIGTSHPGHDRGEPALISRYTALQQAGISGVVYLADHDKTGTEKALKNQTAATKAALPYLIIPAADVWSDLPLGGSIDDAPGSSAERMQTLVAAIPAAVERHNAAITEAAKKTAPPFVILGWCEDRESIYYQHGQTGQVASIKPSAQPTPHLKLAALDWWEGKYGKDRGGIDWAAACSGLIQAANKSGVFNPDRIRGRGVWTEGAAVVWHLGDRLEINGAEVPLAEHRSAYQYPRRPALNIDRGVQPLSDSEGAEILAAVKAMGWASPLDPLHTVGWGVLANVGGALLKRPVLQITSGFGSGKTFTLEEVLLPLLANLAISTSNSTEAGVRQTLGADTLPVLIDESESEDARRREAHLRFARLSFDGTSTSRGSTGGKALSFAVRSSVALVGINATIPNAADRSRTVVVGREQLPQAQWAGVKSRINQLLTPQAGARLLRRVVTNLPTLIANIATFREVVEAQLRTGAGARAGDTYGALLAGAHLLCSTTRLDQTQALDWLDTNGWTAAAALGEEGAEEQDAAAEGRKCLAHLLAHEENWREDTGTGRISVRELIELARKPGFPDDAEQARQALGRRGIRATDCGLEVANCAEALKPIYGNTKWRDGGHRARLLDLPGAHSPGLVRFPALGPSRAAKLPWESLP